MWLCHPSCLLADLNLIRVEQQQLLHCLWTKVLIIPSSQQSFLCPKCFQALCSLFPLE